MIAVANNDGGAMAGFMGMNMVAQAGGVNASQLYQMNEQNKQAQMAQGRDAKSISQCTWYMDMCMWS